MVLCRLGENNIVLNLAKCKLFRDEVTVLGRMIFKGEVKPCLEKIEAIRNFPKSRTIRELRSFLGLVNFRRKFIPELSRKAAPLFRLLEGESKRSTRDVLLDEGAEKICYLLRTELYEKLYVPNLIRIESSL